MPSLRAMVFGPWRAVPLIGVVQIMTWGMLYYTPVLIVPKIAAARGWSLTFAMSGLSLALVVAGLVAPRIGRTIDRFGGRAVMAGGAMIGAAALVALALTTQATFYFFAWILMGVAMAATLYDAAFATLGHLFGRGARTPITAVTLMGGFASTVSWPVTGVLLARVEWQNTYLIYAAVAAFVAAPLMAFALPGPVDEGQEAAETHHAAPAPQAVYPPRGKAFMLVATAFAVYAFIPSALAAHMLGLFQRQGLNAETAVVIGALFGPAQVAARLVQFLFGGAQHPLNLLRVVLAVLLAAFVLLVVMGVEVWSAAGFAIVFGGVNGLMTILRGTLPLALFGAAGFGHLMGRIAAPYLMMQAVAPLALAFVSEHVSDQAALIFAGAFAGVALAAVAMLRRPPDA